MDLSVLKTLEYDKICHMLAERTGSVMGRELAQELDPVTDFGQVINRLEETREAVSIMTVVSNIPLGGVRDIRKGLHRAEIGATLEPAELLAIGSTLYASRRLQTFFADLKLSAPLLSELAAKIKSFRNLEQLIDGTITEQGAVRDDASPELSRLRREIRGMQARVKEKLDSILHSPEYQKYFQDVLITIRQERYVIPVRQEYRNSFPGIIHDQSSSGATVFIEPMAVVKLNNDLKQLMAAEINEIERILRSVSGQVARFVAEIRENCKILARMDFAFAKAKLAMDMKAEMPVLNTKGYIRLDKARHPLIPEDVVVPIDVKLGRDFSTLVITGPNTGGKTVSLKTVGLFAIMTQAGLFLPAASAEMCVFKNIFADIGDEQSIEQSLSTFSAHMTNLVRILQRVSEQDLVLIDEIGAGTDPAEGAALAMAMLEFLHNSGARTIATTHYSELKTFAYSRHGIENASVEFDIQTLKPTYRLIIGTPGNSNAFAISIRLGLNKQIIDRAKELIHSEQVNFEQILASLEEQRREYIRRLDNLALQERRIEELKRTLATEQANLADQKHNILRKASEEAAQLLRLVRREAEEIIKTLKEQFSVQSERERQSAINNARKRLHTALKNTNCLAGEDVSYPVLQTADISPGTAIFITTLNQKGTILEVNGNELVVQIGIMKATVPISDCRLAEESTVKAEKTAKKRVGLAKMEVPRQLDIRGMTIGEGEAVIDKYLDDAVLAGFDQVSIIHGKGTGALRRGIRDYLKTHHHVKRIRVGEVGEGGDGVTIIDLV